MVCRMVLNTHCGHLFFSCLYSVIFAVFLSGPTSCQEKVPTQVFIDLRNLCGSSQPGSITSSHPVTTLLEPVPLFFNNSLRMPGEERRSVDDGLSAF